LAQSCLELDWRRSLGNNLYVTRDERIAVVHPLRGGRGYGWTITGPDCVRFSQEPFPSEMMAAEHAEITLNLT
jgi:hypothetical protein